MTIHPFDDGNGRIARAIAEMTLARGDRTAQRFYSMSAQLESERKEYYRQLELAQRGSCDLGMWVSWFLKSVDRCMDAADPMLEVVLRKARVWHRANAYPMNDRQLLYS